MPGIMIKTLFVT